MHVIYTALMAPMGPIARWAFERPRWRKHRERLGLTVGLPRAAGSGPMVWMHAASVGELRAVLPLVRALRARAPGSRLVLSSTSLAGRDLAATLPEADGAFLLPLDLPGPVERTLQAVRPSLFLFAETELWPNLLRALQRARVPAIMVSGRVSPKAFRRYRWLRPFLRKVLADVSLLCAQSETEAERLRVLGAPPERVRVTGNLKLDSAMEEPSLPIDGAGPLWIAASTHAGEEEACLRAFVSLRAAFPAARLLLAPRHLGRLSEVEGVLSRMGLDYRRRTTLAGPWNGDPAILILDTLGELAGLYPRADVAFVGGTLAPIGGHNLAEPAQAGVPTLFGPHVESVPEMARALEKSGGGRRVETESDLRAALGELLGDAPRRRQMAEAARETFPPSGAVEATLAELAPFLEAAGV